MTLSVDRPIDPGSGQFVSCSDTPGAPAGPRAARRRPRAVVPGRVVDDTTPL
ncbi:hypothetical protein [Amycolatopsis magusensis]|uniref:Uncharacterized protein n=1 Tax=Amycolatopsis magusensis TaxID=882444 RepID=A0ABS4PRR5_9PSEU|nr:hypothetical protein [Amycolatopsis magusensis]MBP2181316.1 hypothetical protein [Amycolatopsis magusensis]